MSLTQVSDAATEELTVAPEQTHVHASHTVGAALGAMAGGAVGLVGSVVVGTALGSVAAPMMAVAAVVGGVAGGFIGKEVEDESIYAAKRERLQAQDAVAGHAISEASEGQYATTRPAEPGSEKIGDNFDYASSAEPRDTGPAIAPTDQKLTLSQPHSGIPREIPRHLIAEAAYYIHISGSGGSQDDNWFRAERELSASHHAIA